MQVEEGLRKWEKEWMRVEYSGGSGQQCEMPWKDQKGLKRAHYTQQTESTVILNILKLYILKTWILGIQITFQQKGIKKESIGGWVVSIEGER